VTQVAGFFAPWLVYALVIALQLVVPARHVDGYVRDDAGHRLHYRLNGLRVFAVILALYFGACQLGWLARDFLWTYRFEGLAGACTLGLLFTAAIVIGAPRTGRNLAAELFFGRRFNPQYRALLDAKMSLYLVGAVMLALNAMSFTSHQLLAFPDAPSWGMVVYAGMFLFFASEYLYFEEVHLYTYDFFAERVGFKLGWGCITFYPYFYCVGLWSEADRPAPASPIALPIVAASVFVTGWMLSRGANLQKFYFKTRPERGFLFAPEVLRDGEHALLCSGFWGVSRHINYLGEIVMAIGLTLALGRPLDPIPWLYPIYYLALLLPRQADDDRRCAAKYGALWTEYCRRVPYRIIPKLY
jgi:protein-S-isoprenylcysteine O-methyltransferase Ste14